MSDRCCEVCGNPITEVHHIIHRSQAAYLTKVELNFKYLCPEHHRGNHSPHMVRNIDLEYKLEYQDKVESLFTKEYYTEEEIKKILNINTSLANKLTKPLIMCKEGYRREDIIRRMMGGKCYAGLDDS